MLGGGRTRKWAGGSKPDDFLFKDCLVTLSFEGEGEGGARDDLMVYIKSMSCRRAISHFVKAKGLSIEGGDTISDKPKQRLFDV